MRATPFFLEVQKVSAVILPVWFAVEHVRRVLAGVDPAVHAGAETLATWGEVYYNKRDGGGREDGSGTG